MAPEGRFRGRRDGGASLACRAPLSREELPEGGRKVGRSRRWIVFGRREVVKVGTSLEEVATAIGVMAPPGSAMDGPAGGVGSWPARR